MNSKRYEKYAEIVHELDPCLDTEDETFNSAVLLVAAADVGPNMRRIRKVTGLNWEFIKERFSRLRENDVFVGGKIHCDWQDEETGGIAFWLDVAVAEGFVQRSAGLAE